MSGSMQPLPRRGPYQYDPSSVTITFGNATIQGFAEGRMVEYPAADVALGVPTPPWVGDPARSGRCTITLVSKKRMGDP